MPPLPLPATGRADHRRAHTSSAGTIRPMAGLPSRPLDASPEDVRAFYAALGIELPAWAHTEASVRCFADPDAHAHSDRSPSCSVSLVKAGAFHCHACGARGGAYDAAIARGHMPRSAMDLLIDHHLAERRPATAPRRRPSRPSAPHRVAPAAPSPPVRRLEVDEAWLSTRQQQLDALWPPRVLRDEHRALWSHDTLRALGCGWDKGRIATPIRDGAGQLCGMLRYAPTHDHAAKLLAMAGTRLGLLPHPAAVPRTHWMLLCEGPPDMFSARSQGLPAFAVPGDHAWEAEWAQLFRGHAVSIAMDCDAQGRAAAERIHEDLADAGATPTVVDLAAERADGYDLTDWLLARKDAPVRELAAELGWRPRRR